MCCLVPLATAATEWFFKSGFGTIDLFQSYMLVHINSPQSRSGDYKYAGHAEYSFASDYIFKWLVDKHQALMLAGAKTTFNADSVP